MTCTSTIIMYFKCLFFFTSGERIFPPASGFSFSTWFCVERFSGQTDQHPLRLLTIVRQVTGLLDGSVCLSVYISPRDRALVVSTREANIPSSGQ